MNKRKCRRKAFECEHKALAATEAELRRLYWQLAGLWRGIARLTADHEAKQYRREGEWGVQPLSDGRPGV